MGKNIKRKRGGQKGNQNARKHGFYSLYLSRPESLALQQALDLGDVDRNTAVLRIKLSSALCIAPGNRRVLGDASRLLVKRYRSGYDMDKKDKLEFKRFIRIVIKEAGKQFSQTNEAESGKNEGKSQNET
jgi:hypothetical protein